MYKSENSQKWKPPLSHLAFIEAGDMLRIGIWQRKERYETRFPN